MVFVMENPNKIGGVPLNGGSPKCLVYVGLQWKIPIKNR
jgi:hypothetical protein